jgi:hypothetical protein
MLLTLIVVGAETPWVAVYQSVSLLQGLIHVHVLLIAWFVVESLQAFLVKTAQNIVWTLGKSARYWPVTACHRPITAHYGALGKPARQPESL